jgi:methionyl aminopeptidase
VGREKNVIIKTPDQVQMIRQSSLLIGETLAMLAPQIKSGVTTNDLNKWAHEFICDHNAKPGFLGYNGFPKSICASVNSAVVHGIPNDEPLKSGDIVSVDIGVLKDGFWGDSAFTFGVDEIAPEVNQLLKTTYESLLMGVEKAVAGNRVGDIGYAVQQHAESQGYGVVRELVGHGVGIELHEAPEVPNYGRRGSGLLLQEGFVIAIEPMINLGSKNVRQSKDGWTIVTSDNKPSAHFEHTVYVGKEKVEVLSSFEEVFKALAEKK